MLARVPLFLIVAGVAAAVGPRVATAAGPVEVQVRGVRLDPTTGSPVVSLIERGGAARELPIWVGPFEAEAIAAEMQGAPPPRPLTHDLMKTIVERLGAHLDHVTISDVRDNTYFATLHLATPDGADLPLDARPSDAIALALRLRGPILVDEAVFAKSSQVAQVPIAARIWGLTIQDMTPGIATFFKTSGGHGVLIADVGEDAPAHDVLRGDVITALDGHDVGSVADLADVAGNRNATDPVTLSVRRGHRALKISFPLS